jgi:CBS domain-containing protein
MAQDERTRPGQRCVRDVMKHHVVSVVPEMTVRELIQVLVENGISGAPVVNGEGAVVGVVSATDVLRLGVQEAEIPSGQIDWNPVISGESGEEDEDGVADSLGMDGPVAFTAPVAGAAAEAGFDAYQVTDIMTPVAFTVAPGDPVESAARMMRQGRVHRLLVMEHGFLYGVLTAFDLLALIDGE